MTEQAKKYLFDIQKAIYRIQNFMAGVDTFDGYVSDLKTQSPVERQLGIIGEAVTHYHKIDSVPTLQYAHQIVGLRNRIIHAYDNIDHTIVWAILQNYLFPLMQEVEALL